MTAKDIRALKEENARLRFKLCETHPFRPIAWTGGSSPALPSNESLPQASYRRALFREQVKTFSAYWRDRPEWDTFRIFFRRARGDSHATFRDATN